MVGLNYLLAINGVGSVIPKSLSATSLHVWQLCQARWKAEMMDRSRGMGSVAASTGTACHGCLEYFVKRCFIDKTEQPSMELLVELYKLSYTQTFNSFDYDTPEYIDGWTLVTKWYEKTIESFENFEVLLVETKFNFMVPSSAGDIPFNYIFDRFDRIGPTEYRVVDYKTNRWPVTSSELQKKVQARAYGLAAAILLKQWDFPWTRIWVQFDLLRHDKVGVAFTREDSAITWQYIKESTEGIIATAEDEVEERLNGECLFCVRKVSCESLKKNIDSGGIFSLATIEEKMKVRAQAEWQLSGLQSLIKDLDESILTEAKARELTEFVMDDIELNITMSSRRAVDAEMVHMCIGDFLFEKHGSSSITIANVEKLLKGKDLTDEQKVQLRGLIYNKPGEPKVKIHSKIDFGDS